MNKDDVIVGGFDFDMEAVPEAVMVEPGLNTLRIFSAKQVGGTDKNGDAYAMLNLGMESSEVADAEPVFGTIFLPNEKTNKQTFRKFVNFIKTSRMTKNAEDKWDETVLVGKELEWLLEVDMYQGEERMQPKKYSWPVFLN